MRLTISIFVLLFAQIAIAQDCPIDTAGTHETTGFDYDVHTADLARDAQDFADAAVNWFYFFDGGDDLADRLVGVGGFRLRPTPVYQRVCNDIGQCATVSFYSVPYDIWWTDWPGVHGGWQIQATFNGVTFTRFIPADSSVSWSYLSEAAAADKRCRRNDGELRDQEEPAANDDDDGGEDNEDEEENEGDMEDDGFPDEEDQGNDDWDWEDDDGEPCESCEFFFDGDEDGDLNLDEPYDATEIEEL